ncbi:MAG: histidinol-phosphate transaminase, partial [bacterium]|nr:histidinol-phosphate transaminase [bacterium]
MKPQARPNIQGISPYIPGKPIEEVRRELGIKGQIIKLASNENPLGPSPLAVKALRKSLKEINLYPDDGCFALSKRLAAHLGVNEDQLIFGNGSVDVIEFITKTFVAPGDQVVIAEGAFIMYKIAAKMADAKASLIPLKDYVHDLEAMAAALTPQTKVVYIANPNNPTGTMLTEAQVKAFMKKVPESCVVVFDEAYSEYIDRPDFPNTIKLLKDWPNAIVLHTFSKIYGLAGLRVGYGVGSPELIAQIRKVRLPFNISLTGQAACLAALDDSKHLARSKKLNAEGKEFLYQQFQALGISYVPSEGNFILIDPKIDSLP